MTTLQILSNSRPGIYEGYKVHFKFYDCGELCIQFENGHTFSVNMQHWLRVDETFCLFDNDDNLMGVLVEV